MKNTNTASYKYFSPDSLRLAWERMVRSSGRDGKDAFGIEMYAANLQKNLERLSAAILNGEYRPQRPFKYYEPKASRTHRTKSVLYIEDALVYQAIANTVATANYKKLQENNTFVFGSVLHAEVEKGTDLLNDPDAEYYFFEYYFPLYNKFINSVNNEIDNTAIRFKLETDITGFFDCIPHSKLLKSLNQAGVEPEILDLLANCLNMFSGTRESVTPGVGIPQGPAPSAFFANLFLSDLDHLISQNGYTYYRYMDDIRIYEETEEKLIEVLVTIDNYLKGRALSLNTKKTSIREIKDREAEKSKLMKSYAPSNPGEQTDQDEYQLLDWGNLSDQTPDNGQDRRYTIKSINGDDLLEYCHNEITETEAYLLTRADSLIHENYMALDEHEKDEIASVIINTTYRWRSANSILSQIDTPILNRKLIPVWINCIQNFSWKANHFCWNLNKYGPDEEISAGLKELLPHFKYFEWVRYQILSNLAGRQEFTQSELKELFRIAKKEQSPLVRLGYFKILLSHLKKNTQLFAALRQTIRDDSEPYIRNQLSSYITYYRQDGRIDVIKFWFGL